MAKIKADHSSKSISISDTADISDLSLLSELLGENLSYDFRLQAADDLSRALDGTGGSETQNNISIFDNVNRTLSFQSERGGIVIDGDTLRLDLKEIPLNLVYEDGRIVASTNNDVFSTNLSEEIQNKFNLDWSLNADTREIENSSGEVSFETGKIKTAFNISQENQKLTFYFQDPEKKLTGRIICEKSENRDPGFSIFMQKDHKTIFLSMNPQESVLFAEGGIEITDNTLLSLGAEVSESKLSEALRISYDNNSVGSINFELKFNQEKETGSGFEASLKLDLTELLKK